MSESTKPTQASKSAETKSSHTSPLPLINTIKSLQFAWFVGHILTLVGILFYTLTYVKIGARFYRFWYVLALVGVVESFGILLYQSFAKQNGKLAVLLKDDNTHYFFLGAALLMLRPNVLLTLSSFALFSLFHVLAYVKGHLLPALGHQDTPVSSQIGSFVANNNTKSIQLASLLEIYTFGWLALRLLTFRKRSLVPFVVYAIFLKLRFEKSVFTRNYLKSVELRVEDLVNALNVPAVKQGWFYVKDVFKRIGAIHVINDFTKEKLG